MYSELLPHDTTMAELERRGVRAVILSGGPMSVYDEDAPKADASIWSGRLPVLGICYGAQLMALELGGDVTPTTRREYGPATVQITRDDALFGGIDREQPVWMSHGDSITRLPEGFHSTAQTESTPFAGLDAPERNLYGIQFHPEVVHTPRGRDGAAQLRHRHRRHRAQLDARQLRRVDGRGDPASGSIPTPGPRGPDGKVICALSGGVDSAVAAALVHRAVGDRLTCIYVDHGLMRKKESELLRATFEANLGMRLVMVDARERFLARLAGVTDPEEKRRIIGDEFIRVFEEEAAKIKSDAGGIDFLTQGTLYPDVIESTTPETKTAQKIKTHHNVGGLPADLQFQLIEPLRYLFKDEVRLVGLELGLPEAMVHRQPFPGPGLAIRIIGEVTAERLETLRDADWIVIDEIKARGPVPQRVAVVRDPDARPQRRRHGRRADLRERRRDPRRDLGGRHDGRLGEAALRRPGQDQQPDRERGPGGQPGRLRHQQQAPRDDRVGMTGQDELGGTGPDFERVECADDRPDPPLPVVLGRAARGRPGNVSLVQGHPVEPVRRRARHQGRDLARPDGDHPGPRRGRPPAQPDHVVHHRRRAPTTPDPTANAESLAPPPADVRREMRRLEIEAERADLVAEIGRPQDRRRRRDGDLALGAGRRRRRARGRRGPAGRGAAGRGRAGEARGRRGGVGGTGRPPRSAAAAGRPRRARRAAGVPAARRRRVAADAEETPGPDPAPRYARAVSERLPHPGPSFLREQEVRIGDRRLEAGMAKPVDGPDDWWLAVLWVTDADGVVSFRDVAPGGRPAARAAARAAWVRRLPAALSGLIREEDGRLAIRLTPLVPPEDDTRPWRCPLVVRAAFRWEPALAATLRPNQIADRVLGAFGRSVEGLAPALRPGAGESPSPRRPIRVRDDPP